MNYTFFLGFGTGLFLGVALAIIFYIVWFKEKMDHVEEIAKIADNVAKFMEENKDGTTGEGFDKDSERGTSGLGNEAEGS